MRVSELELSNSRGAEISTAGEIQAGPSRSGSPDDGRSFFSAQSHNCVENYARPIMMTIVFMMGYNF